MAKSTSGRVNAAGSVRAGTTGRQMARSAASGRYVDTSSARKQPRTTVTEKANKGSNPEVTRKPMTPETRAGFEKLLRDLS